MIVQKGILSYSLESLGKLYPPMDEKDLVYEGFFSAHRNSEKLRHMEIFKYPCRVNAFLVILCVKGSSGIIINMKRYTMTKNCLFLSTPNNIFQVEHWGDCETFIVGLSEEFAERISIDYRRIMPVYLGFQSIPFIELSQNEADSLTETILNISRDISLFGGTEYAHEIINTSLKLSAYKFFSIISRYRKACGEIPGIPTDRQEEHYNRFMQLAERNFRTERKIGFYASHLSITPKYLSSLIRRRSGRSAAELINELVTMEARYLLKFSEMSIQEISDSLSFPNQSFFSQYFRRLTGLTPTAYRRAS